MTVYVAEINGRAIAAFNAENEIQAEVRATSKPFRADLTVLKSEGNPLWNGRDEIFIRKAFPEEEAQFDASQARAIKDKEIDEDDDWLMFLVPVTDPTDDFDPYDSPGGWSSLARCPARPVRTTSGQVGATPPTSVMNPRGAFMCGWPPPGKR
jgi:hypothetical protein